MHRNRRLPPDWLEVVNQVQLDEAVAPNLVVESCLVDTEKTDGLQAQRPLVRNAPVQLDSQYTSRTVHVFQNTGDDFGALDIVERKACAEEEIVLEDIGGISTPSIVVPLTEQGKIGSRAP